MKTRFVASQVDTGARDLLMFKIEDGLPDVHAFYKKKKTWEQKTGEPRLLQVELTVHYNPRSRNQLNLAWELETRIAQKENQTKDEIHRATRANYYPTEELYNGSFGIKEELTTVDESQVIQKLIVESVEKGIDIYDIWILFTHWRWGMEKDPLEGKYGGPDDYREMHPLCEACGKYLLTTGGEGIRQHAGHLAHIISRGAGGPDTDWNWFMLCHGHHIEVQHAKGWERLLELFPFLKPKYDRAHKLFAELPKTPPPQVSHENHTDSHDFTSNGTPPPEPFEDDIPWEDPPPAEKESQVDMVKRIFKGEEVNPPPEPKEQQLPGVDPVKDKMMERLNGLRKTAEEKTRKYYGKKEATDDGQQDLLDDKPEPDPPVDPKKAQYKDDDKEDPMRDPETGELLIF